MSDLNGLDDHIMGTYDPDAPCNQDNSDFDKWYGALEVEDALDILDKKSESYSTWCGEHIKEPDDPHNMEAFIESREQTLFEHFVENIREERND